MLSAAPTREDQVKIGRRFRLIPRARMVRMVTIVLTPETVTEITKTIMQMEKASIAGGACTESGAYVVQPASTPPSAKVASNGGIAETTTQKLIALSLGKAMSFAPIMIGMMKFVKGPVTMMMVAMIITIPWMETMALYEFGERKVEWGVMSCVRIIIARVPPIPKRIITNTRYCVPTTLWSVQNFQ